MPTRIYGSRLPFVPPLSISADHPYFCSLLAGGLCTSLRPSCTTVLQLRISRAQKEGDNILPRSSSDRWDLVGRRQKQIMVQHVTSLAYCMTFPKHAVTPSNVQAAGCSQGEDFEYGRVRPCLRFASPARGKLAAWIRALLEAAQYGRTGKAGQFALILEN